MGRFVKDWLQRVSKTRVRIDKLSRWKKFAEWLHATVPEFKDKQDEADELIVKEYEETSEKQFRRKWQGILEKYVVYLLRDYPVRDTSGKVTDKKGMAPNSARSYIGSVRAFFTAECCSIKVTNVPKPRKAVGEHKFSIEDLRKMFQVADTRDKAILATAVSLGWDPDSFQHLPRKLLKDHIARAREQGVKFVHFDWYREKESTEMMACLTPEAIDWLEKYFDKTKVIHTEWAFPNSTGKHPLSQDAINDVVKRLVKEANVTTTGKVRFYGISRKFLIPMLAANGLSEWETKLIVGKTIPSTDSTYLAGLKHSAFKKYCEAYPKFSLYGTALTPSNNVRLDKMEKFQLAMGKAIVAMMQSQGYDIEKELFTKLKEGRLTASAFIEGIDRALKSSKSNTRERKRKRA